MAKAKLNLQGAEQKKVAVAAHYSDIKLDKAVVVGDSMRVGITYRTAQQLVDFGNLLNKVSGNEPIETVEPKKESADTKKKA